jgi:hypothetical protein
MDGTLGLSKDVLDRTPTEVIELLLEQAERVQKLEVEIEQLNVENGKLRETLGKNSSNSSMPPSSDGPRFHVKRKPPTSHRAENAGGKKVTNATSGRWWNRIESPRSSLANPRSAANAGRLWPPLRTTRNQDANRSPKFLRSNRM